MKIVLASSNKNKIKEFKRILEPLDIELITQTELGVKEVPETGVSFEENSIIKSKNAYMQTNCEMHFCVAF
jgi:XTP/dITP diphosphohydrolase